MFLPFWAIILLLAIAVGAVITFILLMRNVLNEDWGIMTYLVVPALAFIAFTASLFWYIWIWFWLYNKFLCGEE